MIRQKTAFSKIDPASGTHRALAKAQTIVAYGWRGFYRGV
jgi:hypothetical protein